MRKKQLIKKIVALLISMAAGICLSTVFPANAKATGLEVYDSPGFTSSFPMNSGDGLKENYNADYDLYEESLNNLFFFYSNVSNGSITDKPVVLEFPSNLIYEFQKDGANYNYYNKNEVSSPGNYTVIVKGEYEGTSYRGTFRFSIREPRVSEPVEEPSNEPEIPNIDEIDEKDPLWDEDAEINEDDLYKRADEALEQFGEDQGFVSHSDLVLGNTGLGFVYNENTSMYEYGLYSGGTIVSNVINGEITNDDVAFSVSENVSYTIYLNGEIVEVADSVLSDPGFYRIVFKEDNMDFALNYQNEWEYPYLHFRIVNSAVNDIEYYNAPTGCVIRTVQVDDSVVFETTEENPRTIDYYRLENDGDYYFEVYNATENKTEWVNIVKDTEAPIFGIEVKNGKATVSYESDDIKSCELWINNEKVENFDPTSFVGRGRYELKVTDVAGNSSYGTFFLKNSINFGSIAAIALFLIIVGLGIWLVVKTKTQINVR